MGANHQYLYISDSPWLLAKGSSPFANITRLSRFRIKTILDDLSATRETDGVFKVSFDT